VSGAVPLALGGRVPRKGGEEENRQGRFSGHLDEVRIWGKARSLQAVHRTKDRPLRSRAGGGRRLVHVGFESDDLGEMGKWPDGARRVPATLSFRPRLRNLRAQTNGRSVTLRWTAENVNAQSFVVERSKEERAFTKVAELKPAEARQSSVSDAPTTFAYTDEGVTGQVVFYRIRLKGENGEERTSGTIKIGLGPATDEQAPVKLIGNFPNPFSKTTTVAFEVNDPLPITITVWDLQGHQIATLADGRRGTGYHEVPFEARKLPSGTYFLKLKTPTETLSHRMVVVK